MTQDQPGADAQRRIERSNAPRDTAGSARRRVDERLDEALEATFPASDPVALTAASHPAMPEGVSDR